MSDDLFSSLPDNPIRDLLKDYLEKASDNGLFHIDVYGLADLWGVPRSSLLALFIRGVDSGLFTLRWEYHCPMCGGLANESLSLRDSHRADHCAACQRDFNNALDSNIQVFFSVSPAYKALPESLSEAYIKSIRETLEAGEMVKWKTTKAITGMDVVTNSAYRAVFGEDVLPVDQSLEITRAALLFTDIKGSTAMYERLGDHRAFNLVRDHFNVVFSAIMNHSGYPVKTIGDAVMGVFQKEEEALSAALEMNRNLEAFNKSQEKRDAIKIKIGIHSGAVIAVTLNGRMDFFGTTVNQAARIQHEAGPGEILITRGISRNIEVRQLLPNLKGKLKTGRKRLRGIKTPVEVMRIPAQ